MKTHTTFTLRTLVLNDMNAEKHKITKQEISVWMAMLPEITREMFETIYFFTHGIFQRSLIARQIRQIQRECIYLLDCIDKYQAMPAMMNPLKSSAIKCLDQVLEKIESDCSSYLQYDILMPSLHLKREKIAVEANKVLLLTALKNMEAGGKLQKLIIEGMSDLLNSARCYYYRMIYMKKLQEGIIQLCKAANKQNIDHELLRYLLAMNYNTAGFVKYYEQKIAIELAECIEEDEQYKYLYLHENKFGNPHHRKSALGYDIKCRAVNQILYDFVKLELNIREKRAFQVREELRLVTLQQSTSVAKPATGSYKIRTAMSVSALAYFIRLMINAKAIEPGVRTELLAFICRTFQTPNAGINGISAHSMGVKYKQVVQSTARTVRVLLVRMLKELDDEFG